MHTGNSEQITQYFTVTNMDANGNMGLRTLVPTLPLYGDANAVNEVSENNQLYAVDGFTKITFKKVLPETTFDIWLFPTREVVKVKFLKALWQCICLAGLVIKYSIVKQK